jgi:hypothetical protein
MLSSLQSLLSSLPLGLKYIIAPIEVLEMAIDDDTM